MDYFLFNFSGVQFHYTMSRQFKLRVPKALHKLLSQHAKQEGISMNQYCVYLLTRNDALNAK